jgi:hypothetical protein
LYKKQIKKINKKNKQTKKINKQKKANKKIINPRWNKMTKTLYGNLTTKTALDMGGDGDENKIVKEIPYEHQEIIRNADFRKFLHYMTEMDDSTYLEDEFDIKNEISGYLNQMNTNQDVKLRVQALDEGEAIPGINTDQVYLNTEDPIEPYIRELILGEGEDKKAVDCIDVVIKQWSKVGTK